MPKKEALMVRTVFALARGCGDCQLSDDASSWFHSKYYPWIDTPKEKAGGKSPLDVWDTEGKHFLSHFEDIGKRARDRSSGGVVEQTALEDSAREVQGALMCPYCPDI
jgi:hypothetical protein